MYELDDLPPQYEEEEGPDYSIIEKDQINQTLDNLDLPNYDTIEIQLTQDEMNDQKRKSSLNKILKNAKDQRQKLTGYNSDTTKKLNKGLIPESEAQYRRKIITDTRKVLTDYIKNNKQKSESIKGSGLKRRKKGKRGGQIMFFNDPTEMMKKLELIIGSMLAGNNSIELRNTGVAILDMLLRNSVLNRPKYNKLYKNYFSTK